MLLAAIAPESIWAEPELETANGRADIDGSSGASSVDDLNDILPQTLTVEMQLE